MPGLGASRWQLPTRPPTPTVGLRLGGQQSQRSGALGTQHTETCGKASVGAWAGIRTGPRRESRRGGRGRGCSHARTPPLLGWPACGPLSPSCLRGPLRVRAKPQGHRLPPPGAQPWRGGWGNPGASGWRPDRDLSRTPWRGLAAAPLPLEVACWPPRPDLPLPSPVAALLQPTPAHPGPPRRTDPGRALGAPPQLSDHPGGAGIPHAGPQREATTGKRAEAVGADATHSITDALPARPGARPGCRNRFAPGLGSARKQSHTRAPVSRLAAHSHSQSQARGPLAFRGLGLPGLRKTARPGRWFDSGSKDVPDAFARTPAARRGAAPCLPTLTQRSGHRHPGFLARAAPTDPWGSRLSPPPLLRHLRLCPIRSGGCLASVRTLAAAHPTPDPDCGSPSGPPSRANVRGRWARSTQKPVARASGGRLGGDSNRAPQWACSLAAWGPSGSHGVAPSRPSARGVPPGRRGRGCSHARTPPLLGWPACGPLSPSCLRGPLRVRAKPQGHRLPPPGAQPWRGGWGNPGASGWRPDRDLSRTPWRGLAAAPLPLEVACWPPRPDLPLPSPVAALLQPTPAHPGPPRRTDPGRALGAPPQLSDHPGGAGIPHAGPQREATTGKRAEAVGADATHSITDALPARPGARPGCRNRFAPGLGSARKAEPHPGSSLPAGCPLPLPVPGPRTFGLPGPRPPWALENRAPRPRRRAPFDSSAGRAEDGSPNSHLWTFLGRWFDSGSKDVPDAFARTPAARRGADPACPLSPSAPDPATPASWLELHPRTPGEAACRLLPC
nr:basic proline-rich protein-like [Cavia porcellus]